MIVLSSLSESAPPLLTITPQIISDQFYAELIVLIKLYLQWLHKLFLPWNMVWKTRIQWFLILTKEEKNCIILTAVKFTSSTVTTFHCLLLQIQASYVILYKIWLGTTKPESESLFCANIRELPYMFYMSSYNSNVKQGNFQPFLFEKKYGSLLPYAFK